MNENSFDLEETFVSAKKSGSRLALMDSTEKNAVLEKMAGALENNETEILAANKIDLENAKVKDKTKVKESELDRLMLNSQRLKGIAQDIRMVAALPDPIGGEEMWTRPNGLQIRRVRVPFGVIGAIYESRPNVTADIASLCIKSANACVLRGSASALNSNRAIVKAIKSALPKDIEGAVAFVDTPDRSAVERMMNARGKLDLLIPRGGAELIKRTVENSIVPVIETGTGNCHVFVDEDADQQMAEQIIINSKCQRPGVCNAEEKLLVHEKIAKEFIPKIAKRLQQKGVEIRGCEKTLRILPRIKAANEEDWPREYLDLIIAIRIVRNVAEAIEHINKYNSKHTEAIITKNHKNAELFTKSVDAAVVMVNASTRFTDGGQFGFGAEIGISTQKLHARGPMGLRELTTYKYIVQGSGQVRA
ncbi:glutamate-5-semialdehyde dehydrogenase [Candidatus Micrarchaeota archaeon]|nr:glutamate-5-semialdehyde dehydrogenase [Candidatus Micrarchaeota archaeon]